MRVQQDSIRDKEFSPNRRPDYISILDTAAFSKLLCSFQPNWCLSILTSVTVLHSPMGPLIFKWYKDTYLRPQQEKYPSLVHSLPMYNCTSTFHGKNREMTGCVRCCHASVARHISRRLPQFSSYKTSDGCCTWLIYKICILFSCV